MQLKKIFTIGLFTGLYLFLLESIERNYNLSPYFLGISERFALLRDCTLIVPGVMFFIVISSLPFLITTFILNKLKIIKPISKLSYAFCIYTLEFLLLMLTTLNWTYALIINFLEGLADKSIPLTPRLLHHPFLTITAIILSSAFILAFLHTDYIKWFTTTKSGILFTFLMFFIPGNIFYWANSHLFVGHYEATFHKPLSLLEIVCIWFSFIVLTQNLNLSKLTQRTAIFAAITVAAMSVFMPFYFNQNQNIKALIWRRSVLPRQFIAAMQEITDKDKDGVSSIFAGGDTDNSNPQIHPLATEIQNNGIDENNFGGDGQPILSSVQYSTIPQKLETPVTKPNILFISIDTLRADHLGCYGYERKTSPNIDKFASDSLLFLNSYSQASNTGHSFSSIMTSSYGEDIFSDQSPTIATTLEKNGYRTILLSKRLLGNLLKNKRWSRYQSILYRGINKSDVMQDTKLLKKTSTTKHLMDKLDAQYLTDKLIEFLKTDLTSNNNNSPFFIWAHLTDPHASYLPHPEFNFGQKDIDLYDGEIAYTDYHLNRLFTYLEQSKLIENTLVIITSDHGESFGEHGAYFHGSRPYQEQIHVPLIVRAPNTIPRKIETPVASIDIATTMLSHANIPFPQTFRGINLLKFAKSESIPPRLIVSETPRNLTEPNFQAWAAVETNYPEWKLIYDVIGNTWELYNLHQDPSELHNVIDQHPNEATILKQSFGKWMDLQAMHPNFRNWKPLSKNN